MSRKHIAQTATLLVLFFIAIFAIGTTRWEALSVAKYFLLQGIVNTFLYSIYGALIGIAGGFLLAAARLYGGWPGKIAATFVVSVQALPALLVILSCYFTLPELIGFRLTPETAAIVGLGIISSTYYCEAARASVAAVDRLQWDVAVITGLSRTTALLRVILPQALPAAVPAIGTASIIVYKLSTLLYPLGIQDFFRASVLVNNHLIDPVLIYSMITIFYYVSCKALTLGVRRLSSLYIKKSGGSFATPASLTGV